MIKKIVVRIKQIIQYVLIYLRVSILKANKIYLKGYKSEINIRINSSDLLTFHQIFTFKEYDFNLGFVPTTIIDAGANIGLATVYFENRFPNAKIIAIEPEKSNFEMLKLNSKCLKNIILHKKALSNRQNLDLNVIDKGYGNWGFITQIADDKNIQEVVDTVKTITIDEVIIQNNLEFIDLLKIDIEGAEKELF